MNGPRWADNAAEQLDKSLEDGELTDAEYNEEMRGIQQEVHEEAAEQERDYRDGW